MRRKLQEVKLFALLLLGVLAIVSLSRWLFLPAGASLRPLSDKIDFSKPSLAQGAPSKLSILEPTSPSPLAPFSHKHSEKAVEARAVELYGKLPLSFEANQGQTHEEVKFLSRGKGYTLFLTSTEAVMVLRKPRAADSSGLVRGEKRWQLRSGRQQEGGEVQNGEATTQVGPLASQAQTVVRMKLVGANPASEATGLQELPGKSNYFIGNDPAKWRTNIPRYAKVKYQDVYPGIDLVYYGNQRQLEYDFVVAPGADPNAIQLAFEGADKIEVDGDGHLELHTASGQVQLRKPLVYQEIDGIRQEISGAYVLNRESKTENLKLESVGFQLASYDASKPLIIDPVLNYSTYLGGSGIDNGLAIAVDSLGQAYVMGITGSPDFPTTAGAFDTTCGTDGLSISCSDVFVTKLNSDGSDLIYSAFLGGSGAENPTQSTAAIAVDSFGNAYVVGTTTSCEFPTTPDAFQSSCPGGSTSAFVTKLNANGSMLVYSTYLGGGLQGPILPGREEGRGIAVDSAGNAYVTGETVSTNFPTTPGAFQVSGGIGDAFVTKLNPSGSGLIYSTYLGGGGIDIGFAIAVDSSGNAYVTGSTQSTDFPTTSGVFQPACNSIPILCYDAFVTKLNPTGSALVYSSYLGGDTNFDIPLGIAVDSQGNAYVTGQTKSDDFPTVNPIQGPSAFIDTDGDGFVTKLNADGSALVYSTYLGGSDFDAGFGIAVDPAGNAYITGSTDSPDFPIANAWQPAPGLNGDAFVTKLSPTGSLIYSTFFGGFAPDEGHGIAVDGKGSVYVTGFTFSADFPTVNPLQPGHGGSFLDAFVAKFSESNITADLSLAMVGSADLTGAQITYTITITNNGPDDAPRVSLDDLLPQFGATFVSAVSTQGTCARMNQRVSCSIGTLATGAAASVVIVITYNAQIVPLINKARVNSGSANDPDISNNSAALDFSEFAPLPLQVSIPFIGSGRVVSDPTGIDCPNTCAAVFNRGTVVALMPIPANGFVFDSWGGDCSGSGSCVVTMTRHTIVSANFVAVTPTPLTISTSLLPQGEVGIGYNASLGVSGGLPPYTVSVISGALPPGLKLGSPTIIGTPQLAGNKRFTIRVTDQLGASVSKRFTLNILKALSISTSTLKVATRGKNYKRALKATGGKKPYSWSELSGNLTGTGLTLNGSTGAITGIPTQTGSFNLTFRVTDPLGGQAQKNLTLTVN